MPGEIVKSARKARGWTQEELAVRADVSYGTVRRVERGEGTTLDVMTKIANALDLSAHERAQCLGAA